MSRFAVVFLTIFAALPGALGAQKTLCFNGSRMGVCRNFMVVEMQGILPVAETSRTIQWPGNESLTVRDSFGDRLEWHLGLMHNVSERWAVGGAVGLGTGAAGALTSLTARGRRWLTDDVAVDVSGGLLYGASESGGNARRGTLVDGRLNFNDDVYAGLRWEQLYLHPSTDYAIDPGGRQHALSLLLGTGTEWAAAGTGALGVWTAIMIGVLIGTDS